MSDLQIGLILLGLVLIVGVLLFNWWQDRRIRRQMQQHFPEREHDPLMGASDGTSSHGQRVEPGFAFASDGAQDAPGDQGDADDDTDDTESVDPATEVVIDVTFAEPVESVQLYQAVQSLPSTGTKPVRIFAARHGIRHRARLRPGESYDSVQLAVLLANRSGPLTDIEWSTLWTFAQGVAERLDGSVEGPELQTVLARAQEIDQVCAGLDAQVGLVLDLAKAWAPGASVGRGLSYTW